MTSAEHNRADRSPVNRRRVSVLVAGLALATGTSVALGTASAAQAAQPEPEPAPTPASAPESEASPAPLPSLDELLGLDEDEQDDTPKSDEGSAPGDAQSPDAESPESQQRRDLERKLTARDAADALNQALTLMDDTADRLTKAGGAGLETQRLQEDILRKLDTVIDAAEQNQGQGSGSSSGSQSRQRQQSQSPGQQQSGGQQSGSSRGDGNTPAMPAQGGPAQLAPQQLLDASAWGNLPERLRDSVRQGLSDEFSAAYRALTEAYYRRLAEEAESEQR